MAVLVLLFFLGLRNAWGDGDKSFNQPRISKFSPPTWIWIVFGLLALVLRFGMLSSFEGWPGGDDALQGLFALDLNRHWTWRMFYTTGQHPPLWIWLISLFYRFSSNSAFNLWFPPALVSSLFVMASALVARWFFPKGMVFPFFLVLSFGFWPLFFGRFCVQADLVPLLEVLVLLCIGGLWKSDQGWSAKFWAVALGLSVGTGAYSYTGFLTVLLGASMALLTWAWGKRERRLAAILYFVTLLILLWPLMLAVFNERVGGYILSASPIGGFYHLKDEALHAVSYITTLFWGPMGSSADYGPVWGGFLNPVEGTFFLLGLLIIQSWLSPAEKWLLGGAFLLFLLPGLLTGDLVEMLRVIPVMILIYFFPCIGFLSMWQGVRGRVSKGLLITLAVLSFFLNLFHMAKVRSWGRSPN